jgi:hypothetical protein
MDVAALIEQAIRNDIAERKASVAHQKRAVERVAKLRARAKSRAKGDDNLMARVLDWHEASIKNHIRRSKDSVCSLERALEILEDYSFAEDLAPLKASEVTGALSDILDALDQLAAVLSTSPDGAEVVLRDTAPGPCG